MGLGKVSAIMRMASGLRPIINEVIPDTALGAATGQDNIPADISYVEEKTEKVFGTICDT